MGNTVEYDDVTPVKIKKKSKKNKNINDDLQNFGDCDSNVETDGDHVKKKKKDKHSEKRKLESKEDEEIDVEHIKMKKKDKKKSESQEDSDHIKKKERDKKKKLESKEEGDEDQHDKGNLANDDSQKKKNKKRKRRSSESEPGQNAEFDVEKDCDPKPKKKKTDVMENYKKKKKKKIRSENVDTEKTKESTLKTRDMEDKSKEKQKVKVKNKTTKAKSKSKRVSFSGHVEVFPTSDTEREKEATKKDGLLRGVRFTAEEDEKIKQAVYDYIDMKGLGDEGLNMVLKCKSQKGLKGCWREIGRSLPHRPYEAVYLRAHILFERCEDRTWTPEEYEMLRKLVLEHGNDWKKLAQLLGKQRYHVKDAWRRIKLENLKEGKWSQEEYQNLYDLVNLDLKLKIMGEAEKHSKHGMLRDNIPWTVISEKLTTRSDALCCMKWYKSLTSSLVAEKKWCDADDYRMIGALYEIDAACVDDVDWDNVLEHRTGEICLKRWNQMVKHIGDYASKSFCEQVDILANRYCPDLAEIREEWDNKPYVE